jgi:sterol desaturase/sphingolipid hydroxylase (fatty acid hydroxylase superfamily)
MNLPFGWWQLLGIPLGFVVSNAYEWFAHRYVLHGFGKRRESFYSFHFHEHHQASRRHDMIDDKYERSPFGWHSQGKEVLALASALLPMYALVPWAPLFVLTLTYTTFEYYYCHRRAHRDPAWAKKHLPWHYDHHMGPDQDQNWCVTRPWFDHVMGTRVPYLGTEREVQDLARAAQRAGAAVVATNAIAP